VKICRRFFTVLAFCWLSALAVKASAQLTKVTTSYVSKPEDFVDSRSINQAASKCLRTLNLEH
jgi:hypothetical protein